MIQKGDFEKAEKYMSKALKNSESEMFLHDKGKALLGIGLVFWRKGEYNNSLNPVKNSLIIAKKFNDYDLIISDYRILGTLNNEISNYYEAYRNFTQALNYYQKISENIKSEELRKTFRKVYEDLPEIINSINNILELKKIHLDLEEFIKIRDISCKVCKFATSIFSDQPLNNCLNQAIRLKENVVKEFEMIINFIRNNFKDLGEMELLRDFNEALQLYNGKRKSPIPLIRNVYEGLTKKIVILLSEVPKSMKKNLQI